MSHVSSLWFNMYPSCMSIQELLWKILPLCLNFRHLIPGNLDINYILWHQIQSICTLSSEILTSITLCEGKFRAYCKGHLKAKNPSAWCKFIAHKSEACFTNTFYWKWNLTENYFCSNLIPGYQIGTNFCTCHDSCAVVTCAKICGHNLFVIRVRRKLNFQWIWIKMKTHCWNVPLSMDFLRWHPWWMCFSVVNSLCPIEVLLWSQHWFR